MSISISSGRLLQSLYNNNDGTTSYYTGVYSQKKITENETAVEAVDSNSDFRKALKGLKNMDYSTGLTANIKKYAKKLVESYNDLMDNSGNGTKRYSSKKSDLEEVFSDYSTELAKAGIVYDSSTGKLKYDSTKLDDLDTDDFNELEELFSAEGDFVKRTNRLLTSMNSMVKNSTIQSVTEETYVSNSIDSRNITVADSVNSLVLITGEMNNAALAEDGSNSEYLIELLNKYISGVNEFYSEFENNADADYSDKAIEDIQSILDYNEYFSELLEDSNGIDYNSAFNNDEDSLGSSLNAAYKDLFNELVRTAAKGFEISSFVDYRV